MTYEDRIRESYSSFSKSFSRLADYLLDSYLEAAFMTATELGHAINVDATTVVRFSQQLGYSGYPELLREIRGKIKSQLLARPNDSSSLDSIDSVINAAMNELDSIFEQTRRLLDPEVVRALVSKIGASAKIVILPDPQAAGAAHTLQSSLERGGFTVLVSEPGIFDLARIVRLAQKGDLFIAVQSVQESGQIAAALREVRKAGAATAALLGAASFRSAQEADYVLFAYAQPSNELTAMILNAIAYALGQAVRWAYSDRYAGADQAVRLMAGRIKNHGD